jgi:hypothetical protein
MATGAARGALAGEGSPPPKAQLIEEAPPGAWWRRVEDLSESWLSQFWELWEW